jgi:hypothetical protein
MQRWLRQYDSIRQRASGLIHGCCQPIVLHIRRYLIMARFSQAYTTGGPASSSRVSARCWVTRLPAAGGTATNPVGGSMVADLRFELPVRSLKAANPRKTIMSKTWLHLRGGPKSTR